MRDERPPPSGPEDDAPPAPRPGADDLPATAASNAEQRRWRRLSAAAADAAQLGESLDEGVLGETEAVEALAAAHGSEPEAFEVARTSLRDRDAALSTVQSLQEGPQAGPSVPDDADLDDARLEVARLEARLAAARRRLADLEESRRRAAGEDGGDAP